MPAALDTVNRDLGTMAFIITHNMVIVEPAEETLLFSDGQISGASQRHAHCAARPALVMRFRSTAPA